MCITMLVFMCALVCMSAGKQYPIYTTTYGIVI